MPRQISERAKNYAQKFEVHLRLLNLAENTVGSYECDVVLLRHRASIVP